jgi:hypothetical protein
VRTSYLDVLRRSIESVLSNHLVNQSKYWLGLRERRSIEIVQEYGVCDMARFGS